MRFGAVPLDQALGAVLAHAVPLAVGKLKKGRVLGSDDLVRLAEAGLSEVIVARLGPGDVPEDAAALRLARAVVPDPGAAGLRLEAPFTGRVNIRATWPGVLALKPEAIAALNAVDPMITLATLPPWQRVEAGMMVGTVKIIAYGVPDTALQAACQAGAASMQRLAPVVDRVDLIVTETAPGVAARDDKGVRAVWARVARLGMAEGETQIVAHRATAVAAAIGASSAGMVMVLTGSATSDIADVMPAGLVAAGGKVIRFGMPVDPGNLLVLGAHGGRPVIWLPGCARSPALNGADWVLERVACGLALTGAVIAAMGVGGLLKEIPSRPQPRARPPRAD